MFTTYTATQSTDLLNFYYKISHPNELLTLLMNCWSVASITN